MDRICAQLALQMMSSSMQHIIGSQWHRRLLRAQQGSQGLSAKQQTPSTRPRVLRYSSTEAQRKAPTSMTIPAPDNAERSSLNSESVPGTHNEYASDHKQ